MKTKDYKTDFKILKHWNIPKSLMQLKPTMFRETKNKIEDSKKISLIYISIAVQYITLSASVITR